MSQLLINVALSFAAADVLQDAIEAQQVRKKVRWLKAALHHQQYTDRIPFKIDTRLKSYAISLAGLIGFVVVTYPVFWLLHLSVSTAFMVIIALLVLSYWLTAILLDKYHVEIGALTHEAEKNAK